MAHLVDHADHRRRQFLGSIGLAHRHRDVGFDATELLKEVDVEVGPAKLAVGDRLQPHVLLELDDLGDRLVLDGAQLRRGDLTFGLLRACIEQGLRTQEAADVVVAGGELGH